MLANCLKLMTSLNLQKILKQTAYNWETAQNEMPKFKTDEKNLTWNDQKWQKTTSTRHNQETTKNNLKLPKMAVNNVDQTWSKTILSKQCDMIRSG